MGTPQHNENIKDRNNNRDQTARDRQGSDFQSSADKGSNPNDRRAPQESEKKNMPKGKDKDNCGCE